MRLEIIQKSTGLEATIYSIVSLAWKRHASMQVELELQVPLMEGPVGAEQKGQFAEKRPHCS